MSINGQSILSKLPGLVHHVSGPLELENIQSPGTPSTHSPGAIVFIQNTETLEKSLKSTAVCFLVHDSIAEIAAKEINNQLILRSKNVVLAMALINQTFFQVTTNKKPHLEGEKIHPSAVIHPSAQIGKNVIVGPLSTIGENVIIGDHCIIGGNTHIEPGVHIGARCHIHPQVFIGHSCVLKDKVEVHPQTSIGTEGYGYAQNDKGEHFRIPHYGKVILEEDVHVGAGYCIDRGTFDDTVIGAGTKLDNHGHIAHNSNIGENCLITAGFIMAGSSEVGDNFVCGGRTSVGGHLKISSDVRAAALTVFTKHINAPGAYAGYPIQNHKDAIRSQAMIAKLPEMKRTLNALKKKILD